MGLSKYKLGDLIQESFRKNDDLLFDVSFVRGISNNKQIVETKATVDNNVIRKFYVVNPGEFVYNPRTTRMGDKLGLAYNDTATPLLFSFNNIAFGIRASAKDTILPEYLYMFFNRTEFDRYAMAHGWGSATELFSFDEMCNVKIQLPDMSVQQKYVAVYNAMLANQQSYEHGLADLKLVCDSYIENIRENAPLQKLGDYITPCENINFDLTYGVPDVRGVNNQKELMPTKTSLTGRDLSKFQIVFPGDFVFNHRTSRNGSKFSIAYNDGESPVICTEDYVVFRIKPEYSHKLLARWLYMHFNRPEFDRYVITNSWGSSTEFFNLEDVNAVKIPVPDVEIQQDIVDIFNAYNTRKELSRKLKAQIQNICPILIKGSIKEAQKTDEA